MNQNCTITNSENASISVMVEYFINETYHEFRGEDQIEYERTPHNDFIEINDVQGDLPSDFNEFKEDYHNEIIEQLQ